MAAPAVTVSDNAIEYRIPAGGSVIYTDEIGTELFRVTASSDAVKVAGITVTPSLQAVLNGVTATAAELNKLAGVTGGTIAASKALVVDSNSAISALALPVSGLKIGAGAGTAVDATAAEVNALAGVTAGTAAASKAVVLAAGKTITGVYEPVVSVAVNTSPAVTLSGTTYLCTAADLVMTLPATAAGVKFRFVLTAAGLSVGTGLSISPDIADKIMGAVLGVQFTSLDNKDAICTGATDTEGAFIEVLGDGVDGWYIVDGAGIWAREV